MKARMRIIFVSGALALSALLLGGCGTENSPEESVRPTLPAIESEQPSESPAAPSEPAGTEEPDTATPSAPPATQAPETPPAVTEPPVTVSLPPDRQDVPLPQGTTAAGVGAGLSATVPAGPAVGDDYFADAVFVGDSRTEGFRLYSGINNARYFSSVSLSVDKVFSTPTVTIGGRSVTVADALRTESYGKVYFMLGINELGWPSEQSFAEYYGRMVDIVRETHPDAVIYVQSILPVSAAKDASNSTYTNANVVRFQKAIAQMCVAKGVNYLNVAEAVQDESGCLPSGSTPDGVHLNPDYYRLWADYLRTHTV